MKVIKYQDLCSTNCIVTNIFSSYSIWSMEDVFDYEVSGRSKNLLYYQIQGTRDYYHDGEPLLTLNKNNILFVPDGTRYYTDIPKPSDSSEENCVSGIGISFDMFTDDFSPIKIDEPLKIILHDEKEQFYSFFHKILHSSMNCNTSALAIKGDLYTLLNKIFSSSLSSQYIDQSYFDIRKAIDLIETHPEENLSTKQLADLCFMSESSFLKKFKSFSGGIPPLQYRNNIRIMLAEELIYANKTLSEIAEMLGFYDASHLCKIYKQHKKKTLKNSLLKKKPASS